ncbi:MAG: VWA domain-containing protein [bacterium]
MNFLNPLYLVAALAALVPLIIHLLHRQRARVEAFPSLEFLRKMMRTRTRRFRLKQILLLVTRTLLLVAVAVALARPTMTGGRAAKGHLPTTAVVILDDSFSMGRETGDGSLFEIAVAKADEVLRQMDRDDEVYLLTGSAPSKNLSRDWATRDAERSRDMLGRLACSNLATDLVSPLEEALGLLARSANPNKEIYIVSDMQKAGWEGLDRLGGYDGSGRGDGGGSRDLARGSAGAAGDTPGSAKLLVIDVGEDQANACVADVGFRIPSGSDDIETEVTFRQFGPADGQGRMAEVYLRGDLLARTVFTPGEARSVPKTFRLPPFGGFSWGEVALAEDNLRTDDRRYFALASRHRIVGLVGDTYYIAKALSPEGGGSFTPVELEEGALSRESLSRLDVLVMSNVARLAPLEAGALADFLAGGGSLLVFFGNRVDVGDYNRNLLPRLGLPAELLGTASGGGYFTIDRVDRSHGIFGRFKADTSPFGDARFYTFMKVKPTGGRALAHFSDGSPALIEMSDRAMAFAASADVSWDDLVLTPQFLPVLHEALIYLTSGARLGEGHRVGDEITVRTGERVGEAYLEGPSGSVRLFPEAVGGGMGYRIEPLGQPGVYFLRNERDTFSVFAVNVDVAESDLAKADVSDVASRIKNFDVKRVTGADDIGESVSLLRRGRDLARAFLWAGLVLLLVETLLASTFSLGFAKSEEHDALPNN